MLVTAFLAGAVLGRVSTKQEVPTSHRIGGSTVVDLEPSEPAGRDAASPARRPAKQARRATTPDAAGGDLPSSIEERRDLLQRLVEAETRFPIDLADEHTPEGRQEVLRDIEGWLREAGTTGIEPLAADCRQFPCVLALADKGDPDRPGAMQFGALHQLSAAHEAELGKSLHSHAVGFADGSFVHLRTYIPTGVAADDPESVALLELAARQRANELDMAIRGSDAEGAEQVAKVLELMGSLPAPRQDASP